MTARPALTALGLVAAVAAAVRLLDLGLAPLTPAEAPGAAIAWSLSRGESGLLPTDPAWSLASPLLIGAQVVLFGLLGGSGETAARLPSAVAGTALVLAPWLLRRRLGDETALALAALLALDPVCVEAGRLADAAAIAALLGGLAILGWLRGWWALAAASLGLLLVTGAAAWSLAPVVALCALLGRPPAGARIRPFAAVAGTAALLGATGCLAAWTLAPGASSSLTTWLGAWSTANELGRARTAWARTLLADPLPLALGGVGLILLLRSQRYAAAFVAGVSLVWTALLARRPGGDPGAAFATVLILTAAAAPAVQEVLGRIRAASGASRRTIAIAAVLGALSLPGLVRTGRILAGPGGAPATAGTRLLAEDVERISSQRAGDAHELAVEVVCQSRPDPLLRWALRAARSLRFHPGSFDARGSDEALVIGPEPAAAGESPCEAPPSRFGARYQAGPSSVVLWVPLEP